MAYSYPVGWEGEGRWLGGYEGREHSPLLGGRTPLFSGADEGTHHAPTSTPQAAWSGREGRETLSCTGCGVQQAVQGSISIN